MSVFAQLSLTTEPPVGVARDVRSIAALQSPALAAILRERLDQIEKHGYDQPHDALHDEAEIGRGAMAYLLYGLSIEAGEAPGDALPAAMLSWPWPPQKFRPTDYYTCLVKAAAMALAEADRVLLAHELVDAFRAGECA